jgi:hypothetical protein
MQYLVALTIGRFGKDPVWIGTGSDVNGYFCQMLTFATVVERGSISAAARSIGRTPSAVSKQLSA